MYIDKISKMRYVKVLESLKADYLLKSIVSAFVWLVTILQDMFSTNAELVVLLILAMFVDWLTGNVNAKRNGIKIHSFGWRQSIVKTLEYFLFLFILTAIGNVFYNAGSGGWVTMLFRPLQHIEVFGYFYIILTELKSIAENIGGKDGTASKLLQRIKDKIFGDDNDVNL